MILLVAAMQEEISEIQKESLPDTLVLLTGVGKVNAAMKLSEMILKHTIKSIVNVGFAGASGIYEIGDVVLVNQVTYHDFDLSLFGYQKGQVPGYPAHFTSDKALYESIKSSNPHIKEGSLLTGDYFVSKQSNQSILYDMEGAALYQVAHHFNIPIVSIKVVSDKVDMKHHIENYKQFEAQKGAKYLKQVVENVIGGSL
ncbi:MAG: 5'-methylthioadenosine/S-adenosylhomocysteine nucleosidase [Acholeplasmataceae bacterium]|jgi:adenosylhomocysteine nucleosidase|nr:5'-methylthioadenosine/S-adenosylhomocysteine nucleosidase [Acholeplasmataceae bacterium]